MNQSAEGFGLRCAQRLPWPVGQQLLLNNGGQWYQVKVVYIEEREGDHHIGLRRLGDCNDYRGPSPFRLLWGELRKLFGFSFARNVQILGFGCAFVLFLVVLFVVLNPTAPLQGGSRWLRFAFSGVQKEDARRVSKPSRQPRSVRPATTASSTAVQPLPEPDPEPAAQPESRQRFAALLSATSPITWHDLEGVLDLTQEQSLQMLSLVHEAGPSDLSADSIDTTKIVIDSRKDFAVFLQTLPQQVFSFLSDQQRAALQTLIEMMVQP